MLQVKEALPPRPELIPNTERITLQQEVSQGQRIIASQMILQKASDPFLGWFNVGDKSYYVRQFRDMKGSVDLEELTFPSFSTTPRSPRIYWQWHTLRRLRLQWLPAISIKVLTAPFSVGANGI